MPESFTKGQQIAQLQGQKLICFGPTHGFKRFGQSGQMLCDLFPHMGSIIDETCIIRSMWTEQINHDPAHTFMNTGSIITGRPSMGSWILYGLGAEADNLPGFVVLVSQRRGGQMQPIAARQWSAGILPSKFQGVKFNSVGDPVLYIKSPPGISKDMQLDSLQSINALNKIEASVLRDPEIQTRIAQYEMAFKMQASVPGLLDMSKEPAHMLEMYGATPGRWLLCIQLPAGAPAGRARRALHPALSSRLGPSQRRQEQHRLQGGRSGQPTAALIKDLSQRGMLDDTLVIWGGEFGRTPMSQGGSGRDHHIKGFSFLRGRRRH